MEKIGLVIIVGGQFVGYEILKSEINDVNAYLKSVVENKENTWFSYKNLVFARGDSILGWYFRNLEPSTTSLLAKMVDKMEKPNEGDDWKNG